MRHRKEQYHEVRDDVEDTRGKPKGVEVSAETSFDRVVPIERDGLTDEGRA